MFKYYKEGDAIETPIIRTTEAEASVYAEKTLESGEAKYRESSFSDWWEQLAEDTKREWISEDGKLLDPEYGELSPETGEPIEE